VPIVHAPVGDFRMCDIRFGGRIRNQRSGHRWTKGESIMNKIMCCLACILSVTAFASCASMPLAPIEERSMQKVHDIDLTKNEIYDLSLEWMARTFFDPKEVVELKDKEKGMIIGKGITSFRGKIGWFSANLPCRFTLIVEAKDNKYRTTFTNLVVLWGESQSRPEPLEQKEYVDIVKAKLALLDDDLHGYLVKSKPKTDW
jgi:hypothetical protein